MPVTYTITAGAGEGGSIAPSGAVVVAEGATQSFTIAKDAGYAVLDVLVDGVSVGAVASYTFENVRANHTIHAEFEDAPKTGESAALWLMLAFAAFGLLGLGVTARKRKLN